jgi:hypothetical protein
MLKVFVSPLSSSSSYYYYSSVGPPPLPTLREGEERMFETG